MNIQGATNLMIILCIWTADMVIINNFCVKIPVCLGTSGNNIRSLVISLGPPHISALHVLYWCKSMLRSAFEFFLDSWIMFRVSKVGSKNAFMVHVMTPQHPYLKR